MTELARPHKTSPNRSAPHHGLLFLAATNPVPIQRQERDSDRVSILPLAKPCHIKPQPTLLHRTQPKQAAPQPTGTHTTSHRLDPIQRQERDPFRISLLWLTAPHRIMSQQTSTDLILHSLTRPSPNGLNSDIVLTSPHQDPPYLNQP
jgi:hypothetical protein